MLSLNQIYKSCQADVVVDCIYNGSNSRVRLSGQLSEPFNLTTSILKGDILAPFLFVIILDYVSRQYCFTTHEDPRIDLCDLNFADDIALLNDSADCARDHLVALA